MEHTHAEPVFNMLIHWVLWQAEGKLCVCTRRGKLGERLRLGKGELTSSKQWIVVSMKSSCRVRTERSRCLKGCEKYAERDGERIRRVAMCFCRCQNRFCLPVSQRLAPPSPTL